MQLRGAEKEGSELGAEVMSWWQQCAGAAEGSTELGWQ